MEIRQFTVYGRVQGVGFRYFTAMQAKKLQLAGRVKNLSDGSVLVIAQGSRAQLDAMEQWLRQGPRTAQVERVIAQDYAGEREFLDFGIEC